MRYPLIASRAFHTPLLLEPRRGQTFLLTLARLLSALFAPSSGNIVFDGIDHAAWDPSSLRSRIGMVTQDTRLLATSVRENISLLDASVPLDQIEQAARLAEIHDDIRSSTRPSRPSRAYRSPTASMARSSMWVTNRSNT